MAQGGIDPSEQIPETDLLEHQAPLDPQPLTDAETVSASPEAHGGRRPEPVIQVSRRASAELGAREKKEMS